MSESVIDRGRSDCYQDYCENVPFASVGGLEYRDRLIAPDYIKLRDIDAYLEGYTARAKELYGDDWETCEFSWSYAMTIGDDESK